MKSLRNKILFLILVVIPFHLIHSQGNEKIKGKWLGTLRVQATELRVVFNVSESEDGSLKATLDSPDQRAFGIKVDSVIYNYPNVRFVVFAVRGSYEGKFEQDSIVGTWSQGMPLQLTLKKTDEIKAPKKPQEPKPPHINNDKIKGKWLGTLKVQGIELRIVFNVSENEDGSLKTTLDSPDQGAYGITVDSTIFNYPNVRFVIQAVKGFYEGKFEQDSIVGTWTQTMPLPLTLKKTEKVESPKRPQEPKPPYPYNEEEVSYPNKKAGLTLAGTFTYPKEGDSFPAVVLVSGSGAQNRDEELLGHKPFLVLADYLTRNGIAVLRFDDRGTAKSTGDFSSATTEDFVSDALAGVEYLRSRKEINKSEIGLIGHSEGGLIAPLAAVESPNVDFIVLMAGTGIVGKDLLKKQTALILKANGYDEEKIKRDVNVLSQMYEVIVNEKDTSVARGKLKEVFDKNYADLTDEEKKEIGDPNQFFNQQVKILLSPWFRFFLKYDPYPTLTKVKVPVLAINGEKDLQVPPKVDLEMIEKALKEGGNKNYKVIELPGLNHLFQTAETGSPAEYSKIEETISPLALKTITDWIKEIVK